MRVFRPWVSIIALLALTLGLSAVSFAQKRAVKGTGKKANPEVVLGLEDNLKKIEATIEITKKRIKAPQEIQFLPDLYFMLGELLHDKAAVMMALKNEKQAHVPEDERDFTAEKRISAEAIETYKLIEDRHPNYPQLDRVLFTIAQEYKSLGSDNEAMAYFKKLTEKLPDSPYAVKAHLEIGDAFQAKKDYEFAARQYEKALPKASAADKALAHFKIGGCRVFLGEWKKALENYEAVFTAPEKEANEDLPPESLAAEKASKKPEDKKGDYREEALIASVWPLLELSPAEIQTRPQWAKPQEYFREVSGDKARYRRVLNRLAARLEIKKRHREAAEAQFELFRLSDESREKKAAFEAGYNISKKLKVDIFPEDLPSRLSEMFFELERESMQKGQVQAELRPYEAVFRDLLTTWQKNALSTKRKEDLSRLARSYDLYRAHFPQSKWAAGMRLNQAEAHFLADEMIPAGQAYLEIAQLPRLKASKKRKEYLESALEAFHKMLSRDEISAFEKIQAREGYRETAPLFLATNPPATKAASVRYNVAKTYYDEQKYDKAAELFLQLLRAQPRTTHSTAAALLTLDCYYLREKLKEMAEVGKQILAIPGLPAETAAQVSKATQQAQLKALRSLAGDFQSKTYATKFREFAKRNRNSALGEQALYEAFLSLKVSLQSQAFEVGEEYLGAYENGPRSREILLSLSQLALTLLEYRKAASYLAVAAQKYPKEPQAKEYARQAAQIYDQLGDLNEAIQTYQMAGDPDSALKMLLKYGAWSELNKLAAGVSGLSGQYHQGLSLFRMGQSAAGLSLLKRVASSAASSPDEKAQVAHAALIVGEQDLKEFMSSGRGSALSPALLQTKVAQYQALQQSFQTAVDSGAGVWVIVGLAQQARLNREYAKFLASVVPPAGMSAEQLKKALNTQIQTYTQAATQQDELCRKIAEENEIPAQAVQSCRDQSSTSESREWPQWKKAQGGERLGTAADLNQLRQDPRSVETLKAVVRRELLAGRAAEAILVLARIEELSPGTSHTEALRGIAYLTAGRPDWAQGVFRSALQRNAQDSLAHLGLAAIAFRFGYNNRASQTLAKVKLPVDGSELHPWLSQAARGGRR